MEAFFQSVARAFGENREALPVVRTAAAVLVALGLLVLVAAAVRRWWSRRTLLRREASRLGLSDGDLRFLADVAAADGVAPLALLGHLDLFERATARALAAAVEGGPDPAPLVARLRRALGFDRLPAHMPLLSSRELAPGTALEVAGVRGTAFDVTETSMAIEVTGPPPATPGAALQVELAHAREARYRLTCRLLESRPAPRGGWVVRLGHDERPERVQLREYVRVPLRGRVELVPALPRPLAPEVRDGFAADLVDLSGGGAQVTSAVRPPVGMLALATFTVAGERFEGLRAVVLSAGPEPGGRWRAHLEFGGLPPGLQDRLVAALGRQQVADHRGAA